MTTPPPTVLIGFSSQTDPATLNGTVGALAQRARALFAEAQDFAAWYNDLDDATRQSLFNQPETGITAITAAIGYLSTLAGIFYGTVQQGGTGGTGATTFDFDDALRIAAGPYIPASA